MALPGYRKNSEAVKRATAYRSVIGRIVSFADKEILNLFPELPKVQRLIIAQEYPFFEASKELRDLTEDEEKYILKHKKDYLKLKPNQSVKE